MEFEQRVLSALLRQAFADGDQAFTNALVNAGTQQAESLSALGILKPHALRTLELVSKGFLNLDSVEGLLTDGWSSRLESVPAASVSETARTVKTPRRPHPIPETATPEFDSRSVKRKSDSTKRVRVGDTLGRCLLLEVLGRGLSGTVFRAWHPTLEAQVAVKVLKPDEDLSGIREGRILARLQHPNILRVLDAVEGPPVDFLVLEIVDGLPLGAYLRQGTAFKPARILEIGLQLADALAHTSSKGLLHHDVKPDNILIARDGRTVLADLGVAGDVFETAELLAGTLPYIAPERCRRIESPLSDMYSLGVTLYQLVTGQLPRRPKRLMDLARFKDDPIPPVVLQPAMSVGFSDAIMSMLQIVPEDRPTTFQHLLEVLRRCPEAIQLTSWDAQTVATQTIRASLSGELQGQAAAELFQMLSLGHKSGVLRVLHGSATSSLTFSNGRLIDATGPLADDPEEVAVRFLQLKSGRFAFFSEEHSAKGRVDLSTERLLLEAARRLDEADNA